MPPAIVGPTGPLDSAIAVATTRLPELGPALLVTWGLSLFVGVWLAPHWRLSRPRAVAWLACLATPLAFTFTSTYSVGSEICRLGAFIWTPYAAQSLDVRGNVLLLIPAGAAVLLWPPGPRRQAALLTTLTLPVAIELAQWGARGLGRGCQVGDVINNGIGAGFGFLAAATITAAWRSRRVRGPAPTRDRPSLR